MKLSKVIAAAAAAVAAFSLFCASAATNENFAKELNSLGLFKGTENGFDLDSTLTREQAATMLVRLNGAEKTLSSQDSSDIFKDVPSDRWSYPYVMYCYENNITKGTSEDTFSPEKEITGQEFVTLTLRLLGYENAEPEKAYSKAVAVGLFNSSKAKELERKSSFKRDDMVYVVYRSLKAPTPDGGYFAKKLADNGVISKSEAEKYDVYAVTDDIDSVIDRIFD